MVVGHPAGVFAGGIVPVRTASGLHQRGHHLLDLHHRLQLPPGARRIHLFRAAGLPRRRRLWNRVLSLLLRHQSLCRPAARRPVGARRVRPRRSPVRSAAQRLLRAGEPGAGGDHLLPHAKGAGGHHPGRQRALVPDQHRRHAGAGHLEPEPVLHLRPAGRDGRVGVLQVSRRLDLRRLLPRDQGQRRQADVPRLQQLQRAPHRVHHRQHDDRARRRDVRGLPRVREPGNHQPRARRRSGGGHDTRRHRHALRAARWRHRLHRHEGRDQQADRQLGAVHGFLLVFIMLAGERGIWGTLQPRLQALFSRNSAPAAMDDRATKRP